MVAIVAAFAAALVTHICHVTQLRLVDGCHNQATHVSRRCCGSDTHLAAHRHL